MAVQRRLGSQWRRAPCLSDKRGSRYTGDGFVLVKVKWELTKRNVSAVARAWKLRPVQCTPDTHEDQRWKPAQKRPSTTVCTIIGLVEGA